MTIWEALYLSREFPLFLLFAVVVLLFLLIGVILAYNSYKARKSVEKELQVNLENRQDLNVVLNLLLERGVNKMEDLNDVLKTALNTPAPGGSRSKSRADGLRARLMTLNTVIQQGADIVGELAEKRIFDEGTEQTHGLNEKLVDAVDEQDRQFAETTPIYTQPTIDAQKAQASLQDQGQAQEQSTGEVQVPQGDEAQSTTLHVVESNISPSTSVLTEEVVIEILKATPCLKGVFGPPYENSKLMELPAVRFDRIWGYYNGKQEHRTPEEEKIFMFLDDVKNHRDNMNEKKIAWYSHASSRPQKTAACFFLYFLKYIWYN